MARNYYDISNLLKTDADYMMLLGQRSNGKSYQTKETILKDAINNGIKFVYLRRWVADLKTKAVEDYFADMPLKKYAKEYDELMAYRGYIYLVKKDKNGIVKKKLEIGRYCALNEYERYKSQAFPNFRNIVYEEFITDALYLDDEPRLLQQFVSTVLRLEKGKVFLIGNTLSRVCPYFHEWSLDGVLKQKQGTIELYHYNTLDKHVVTIAVEYCANTNNENVMFFGTASKQIVSGEWDVHEYPRLIKKEYEYDMVYEILVKYQGFKFVVRLMVEPINGGKFLYVYPATKERDIYRIIQEEFSDQPNITCMLDRNKKVEMMIIDCLRLNKICYSDNLTGSDFNKVIENLKVC